MKLLLFVDLHANLKALDKIIKRAQKKDIDAVVCAGDFTIFGGSMKEFLLKFETIRKPFFIVSGNHEEGTEIKKMCKGMEYVKYIHNGKYRIGKYLFVGYSSDGFSHSDPLLDKNLEKFKSWIKNGDKVVVVTHAPPYNTNLDDLGWGHVGNRAVKRFIRNMNPVLAICGHIHECVGEDILGDTRIINPGYKGKVVII